MSILVRPERLGDQAAVRRVNRRAFDGDLEAGLVDRLRAAGAHRVSLVAFDDATDELVGHILFTEVAVSNGATAIGLAPMAVEPARQREGIGSLLVEAGLAACRQLGFALVVVLGHPEYYPRFGFAPADSFGLEYEEDVPTEVFMALELSPGAAEGLAGTVSYRPEFSAE